MTVVPLVFSLLVPGIISAAGSIAHNRIVPRAMLWFMALLAGACLLSAVLTSLAPDLWVVSAGATSIEPPAAGRSAVPAGTNWLSIIFPTNSIKAAADTAVVPIVVFALIFGLAVSRIEADLRRSIETFFQAIVQAIVQAMLMIVHWCCWYLLQASLLLHLQSPPGLASVAGTLLHYVIFVVGACQPMLAERKVRGGGSDSIPGEFLSHEEVRMAERLHLPAQSLSNTTLSYPRRPSRAAGPCSDRNLPWPRPRGSGRFLGHPYALPVKSVSGHQRDGLAYAYASGWATSGRAGAGAGSSRSR